LSQPGLVSIPLGFLACIAGSLLSSRSPAALYEQLRVRAETGLGAERA
jgi:cation/acetate symporter